MQKRNTTPLSEILYLDINTANEYNEAAFKVAFQRLLGASSGVMHGLAVTQVGVSGISVATGSLLDSTFAFGELESASGVTLASVPTSGTRTDTVAARYLEILDAYATGYGLLDTISRTETTLDLPRRKFGAVIITIEQDTVPSGLTSNKMALATMSVTSGGIQSITDVRSYSKISNIDTSSISVGGDLTGTVADATVANIKGIPVSGVGTSGQYLALNDDLSAFEYVSPVGALSLSDATPEGVSGVGDSGDSSLVSRANHVHYSPYDVAGGSVGAPAASGMVLNFVSTQSWSVPASGVGCYAVAQTAATASGVFTIYKNGASSGTITFAAAGTTGTWSGFSAISLVAGDVLTIKAPDTADATLADIGITIKGVLA